MTNQNILPPQLASVIVKGMPLNAGQITKVEKLSPDVIRLDIESEAYKELKPHPVGKIKVMVGVGLFRSYTPFNQDPVTGTFSILVFLNGKGAGSQWGLELKDGDDIYLTKPRASVENFSLSEHPSVVYFGDETTYGAAASLNAYLGQENAEFQRFVFEVQSVESGKAVIEKLALPNAQILLKKSGDEADSNHYSSLAESLRDSLWQTASQTIILSGDNDSVEGISAALSESFDLQNIRCLKVPYWNGRKH